LEFPAFPALAAALLRLLVIGFGPIHQTLYVPARLSPRHGTANDPYGRQEATSPGHGG
jgi:hypothetical protein